MRISTRSKWVISWWSREKASMQGLSEKWMSETNQMWQMKYDVCIHARTSNKPVEVMRSLLGHQALAWYPKANLQQSEHNKNIKKLDSINGLKRSQFKIINWLMKRTWVNKISSSLIGSDNLDWSFEAKFCNNGLKMINYYVLSSVSSWILSLETQRNRHRKILNNRDMSGESFYNEKKGRKKVINLRENFTSIVSKLKRTWK